MKQRILAPALKPKFNLMRIKSVLIVLGLGLWTGAEAAQWGSLRGNNAASGHTEGRRAPVEPAGRTPEGGRESQSQRRLEAPRQEQGRRTAPAREIERGRSETRPGERREVARPEAIDRRQWDVDEERRNAYYWSRFHSGMRIGSLPLGYSRLSVSGIPYYYYEGVYYEPQASGYIVVTPPIGAIVPELPPGAEAIYVGPTIYYYAGGAFYVQEAQGFLVVVPPPGISVPYLPPGAVPATINGQFYYQGDGAYFMPVMQDGVTMYVTTQP